MLRKLARCNRGSVAFATVISLVPLVGFVALGAEAGSWYVTKQNAQNAADAGVAASGRRRRGRELVDRNPQHHEHRDEH